LRQELKKLNEEFIYVLDKVNKKKSGGVPDEKALSN